MERIVRSSHKPCLVTPRAYQPLKRIFLAYDGGKSCQKAIAYLAKLPDAEMKKYIALKQIDLLINRGIWSLTVPPPKCCVISHIPVLLFE